MSSHLEEDADWLKRTREVIQNMIESRDGEYAAYLAIALTRLVDMSAAQASRIRDLESQLVFLQGHTHGQPVGGIMGIELGGPTPRRDL